MDTKKLRQKILDLAIHGKLVPQDPNDEPASVLLERIRAEKEQLIKEGKIKAPKKSKTAGDTSHYGKEGPWELPKGWCWSKIGDICTVFSARRVHQSDWTKQGIPFYRAREIVKLAEQGYVDNELFISRELFEEFSRDGLMPEAGDIMISAVGTIGRTYIVQQTDKFYFKDASVLCLKNSHLNSDYLDIYLQSSFAKAQMISGSKGTTVDTITIEKANDYLIPIPPKDEQKRIIASIRDILPFLNKVETEKQELKRLVDKSKELVLELAIKGKLVPQLSSDEPALELLKRINPVFKPSYNLHYKGTIPPGWQACHLCDIFDVIMGQSPDGNSLNKTDGIEFHQGKICFTEKYLSESDVFTSAPTKYASANSLLCCVRAPVGVFNITPRTICIGRGLCALNPRLDEIELDYWFYALSSYRDYYESESTGTTFKAISGDIIRNTIVLLPPILEEKRILNKITELFTILDQISNSINSSE